MDKKQAWTGMRCSRYGNLEKQTKTNSFMKQKQQITVFKQNKNTMLFLQINLEIFFPTATKLYKIKQ